MMIQEVWEIILLCIIAIPAHVLLTDIVSGDIEIKTKALEIALVCAFTMIYGLVKKIAWGNVLTMVFTIASISFSGICVMEKWLDRHGHVGELGVAVSKLHEMEIALCRLDQVPFAEQCRRWLKSVGDLQPTAQDIKDEYDACGLTFSERLHLSRRAHQELNVANDLLRQGDNLLHPQDQLRGTLNFYRNKVIGFIKDTGDDSGLLGIWGMGGVGKTFLLKLLVDDSRSEYDNDSFQVLFVRAGTGCTVGQVQEAIAASMGLSLERNETSQAKIIHDHLKYKNFLLLLDDLWGYLDLKAVGIPSPLGTNRSHLPLLGGVVGKKQRKVVLTSRNMDWCHKMGCSQDNTIQMKCFDEEDAWELYRTGWPVRRVDDTDKLPEVLPAAQTSSSGSHTGIQMPIIKWRTRDVREDRLSEMMSSLCYFIEDGDAKSLLLGVWGMPGVGKTTLLRVVRDYYRAKPCFNHILFVGAGIGHMVNNVQHAIAINLGLDMDMMSSLDELSRARCIFNYLEHRSFLLLLDDIREPLNWWAIGLPLSLHKQQKIILATRSQAACALMGCRVENIIEMQCLGEDDAWNLFVDNAGLRLIDDHPQVDHLARQMVSRCGGLPLALCSLGRAMSNKRDPREWRSAYSQLTAMCLEACEINEKVGTILLNPT